ncbi:MAG: Hsp70 family protein [Chloroflexota bacterium]
MGYKLAIDFGTTNSVIARWDESSEKAEIVVIPGLTDSTLPDHPAVVPSLVYVTNAADKETKIGMEVREAGYNRQRDNRLFRNFKRGIVAKPAPEPRIIDDTEYADVDAGTAFVKRVIGALPYNTDEIDQLVLTAPVASFEGYLSWLNAVITDIPTEKIRIVDESTAAALGYAVTKPGAAVMVFDFGGGTLDLSLVQLPESGEKTGGFLNRLLRGNTNQHAAKVIAKAGRILGGSDIDQWILQWVLKQAGIDTKTLGKGYATLLTICEAAKIELSSEQEAKIEFELDDGTKHSVDITRDQLEEILEANGFFTALRHVIDKVMHVSRQRGIFKEDVTNVLMVGGSSLMPSVQRTLKDYFTEMSVLADKPFTAVAEGALQVAAGYGLDDYLIHSYGVRHLDPETGKHDYDEIVPMGSRYPTESPIEVMLGAAHANQTEVEFIIGEIDTDSISMLEVQYEDGQAVFVAQAGESGEQIVALNEESYEASMIKLDPPGKPGENRLKASFDIDDRRQLRLTVTDIQTNKVLLMDVAVVSLR